MVTIRKSGLSGIPAAKTGQRVDRHGLFFGSEQLIDMLVILHRGLSDLAFDGDKSNYYKTDCCKCQS
jgi:hypothetical protein